MSRIGKQPIAIPSGVSVKVQDRVVTVEKSGKALAMSHRPEISVKVDEDEKQVVVERMDDERVSRSLHGLTRSLINNMVIGVTQGYEKKLEIVGVGYIASVQGNQLQLRVGFANEIHKVIPAGLDVTCPDQTHVVVKGSDKQQVGQFAAEVRAVRKPEPYKGKGIRYDGEHIKLKPGKAAS